LVVVRIYQPVAMVVFVLLVYLVKLIVKLRKIPVFAVAVVVIA